MNECHKTVKPKRMPIIKVHDAHVGNRKYKSQAHLYWHAAQTKRTDNTDDDGAATNSTEPTVPVSAGPDRQVGVYAESPRVAKAVRVFTVTAACRQLHAKRKLRGLSKNWVMVNIRTGGGAATAGNRCCTKVGLRIPLVWEASADDFV